MNDKTLLTAAACAIAFVVGMKFQQAKAGKKAAAAANQANVATADQWWFGNFTGFR